MSRIGPRIGHDRVVDLLGQGGMGDVSLAYDERLDRKVALESLRADHRPDPDARARFLREARAAAARLSSLPAGHWLIASARPNLGAALLAQRRFGEAERELAEAYAPLSAAAPPPLSPP